MKRIFSIVVLLCALSAPFFAAANAAGDEAAGRVKASDCEGCHGISGYKTAFPRVYTVPYLRGQSRGYLTAALRAYRDGGRGHPSMSAIAASLSDEDIADLAAYYGADENGGGGETAQTEEAKFPQCAACHGAGGNSPIAADYPKLAGQRADYLLEAMLAYRRGRGGPEGVWRDHAIMAAQVAQIGEDDFVSQSAAFAEYFAARAGDLGE
jgi:cytochrome c553